MAECGRPVGNESLAASTGRIGTSDFRFEVAYFPLNSHVDQCSGGAPGVEGGCTAPRFGSVGSVVDSGMCCVRCRARTTGELM